MSQSAVVPQLVRATHGEWRCASHRAWAARSLVGVSLDQWQSIAASDRVCSTMLTTLAATGIGLQAEQGHDTTHGRLPETSEVFYNKRI